jgi:hypothetical protein
VSVALLPRPSFGCGWSCRWGRGSHIAPRFRRPQGLRAAIGLRRRRDGCGLPRWDEVPPRCQRRGPARSTSRQSPRMDPMAANFVTSPVAPPRRSNPAPTRGHERACRRPDDGPPESAYGPGMGIVSPGFSGRGRSTPDLPPGQYLSEDFPVLSAGPTPASRSTTAVHHHHRDRRGPRLGLVRLPCPRHGVTYGRPALCDAGGRSWPRRGRASHWTRSWPRSRPAPTTRRWTPTADT